MAILGHTRKSFSANLEYLEGVPNPITLGNSDGEKIPIRRINMKNKHIKTWSILVAFPTKIKRNLIVGDEKNRRKTWCNPHVLKVAFIELIQTVTSHWPDITNLYLINN